MADWLTDVTSMLERVEEILEGLSGDGRLLFYGRDLTRLVAWLRPSTEDLALTERLRAVGDLLGIRILDHVILGHDGAYRSLADDGVLGGGR